jgi:hypothetical protein
VPELVLLRERRRGDSQSAATCTAQATTVEEAWLIHHLQDHKPRQIEDKDRVGQQYVLLFFHKVYQTLTCKAIWKYGMELAKS